MSITKVNERKTANLPQPDVIPAIQRPSNTGFTYGHGAVDCLNEILQGRSCLMPNDTDPVSASLPFVAATTAGGPLLSAVLLALSLRKKFWGPSIKTPELRESEYAAFFPYLWSEDIVRATAALHQGLKPGGGGLIYFDTVEFAKNFLGTHFGTPTIIDNGDFGIITIWRTPDPKLRIQLTLYPTPVKIVPPDYTGDINDLPVQEPGAELVITQLVETKAPPLIRALAHLKSRADGVRTALVLTYKFDRDGSGSGTKLKRTYSTVRTADDGTSKVAFLRNEPVFNFAPPTTYLWQTSDDTTPSAPWLQLVKDPAKHLLGGN